MTARSRRPAVGRARALLVLVALATALLALPPSATAQGAAATDLRLTAITPWVDRTSGDAGDGQDDPADEDEAFELRVVWVNRGDAPLAEGRVVVELLAAVQRRSELQRVLTAAPGSDPAPVVATSLPLRPLEPGEGIGLSAELPVEDLRLGGVHPVVVSVVRGTAVVDQLRTATVVLTEPVAPRGQVALVASLDATAGPPGSPDLDAWRPSGALGERLADLTAAAPPLVVRLQPALVEDLVAARDGDDEDAAAEASDVLERITGLADAGHELLPAVYADADLAALARGDDRATDIAGELATAGDRRLASLLPGTRFASSTLVPDGPTTPAVARLLGGRLLLRPDAVDGPVAGLRSTIAEGGVLTEGGAAALDAVDAKASLPREGATRLPVALADPVLTTTLDGTTPPLLATQRVLAETHLAARRGIDLVVAPRDAAPAPGRWSAVSTALADAPWVDATSIDAVFRGHATPALPAISLAQVQPVIGTSRVAQVGDGVDELVAALSAIPGQQDVVDGRDPNRLFDQLLRATSVDLADDPRGEDMVADVASAVDDAFGSVELDVPPVTLTSDRGRIPVRVRRTEGGPLRVLVEVEASSGGLTWPGERVIELELEPGEAASIPFEAAARSRGEFPVTVRVSDPNRRRELASTRVAVTSTAISGTALGVVVFLAAVLLLLGRWRRRRGGPEDVPEDPDRAAGPLRVVDGERGRQQDVPT